MARGCGFYNKNYRRQKAWRARKAALNRFGKRAGLVLGCVALLAAVVLSISEAAGGPLPTWQEVYAAFGFAGAQARVPQDAAVEVDFLDVGQGDAVLIGQDGAYCLIDAGTPQSADSLVAQLKARGVRSLSLLVMTHAHADHIGGMTAVLDAFPVQQVLLPDLSLLQEERGALLERVLQRIAQDGIPSASAKVGDTYPLGAGTLTVLSAGVADQNLNNTSVITLFEGGGLRYLSCGDAETAELSALLASGQSLAADVYKATHHGSANSNFTSLLEAVRPPLAVVSCGKDNDFGHPHTETLESFAHVGAEVYRTDEDGAVSVWRDAAGALYVAGANRPEPVRIEEARQGAASEAPALAA